MMTFRALHVLRIGKIVLPIAPDRAFQFFTPEGERSWIPEWEPEYLHPADGTLTTGLVFRTRAGGEETLWLVARYDPAGLEAEYVRIVPDSRMGTVSVRCESAAVDQTEVHVTYELTALSESGNAVLTALSESAYADMLHEWHESIVADLSSP